MNTYFKTQGYTLLSSIGKGAYGEVFLARTEVGRLCALKVILRSKCPDEDHFRREQRAVSFFTGNAANVDGLISILDWGFSPEDGIFYYAMPLADDFTASKILTPGTYRPDSLSERLSACSSLSVEECFKLGIRLSQTLDRLHRRGLVHRDIKPGNVVFIDDKPIIADLGLAARPEDALSLVGTSNYVPPENHGHYSGDIYSLGKLLYVAATGRDAADYPGAPRQDADISNPLYPALFAIIEKACAADPRERYASAALLASDLEKPVSPANKKARRSLVFGIFALPCAFAVSIIALFLAVTGLVNGIQGLKSGRRLTAKIGIAFNCSAVVIAVVTIWVNLSLLLGPPTQEIIWMMLSRIEPDKYNLLFVPPEDLAPKPNFTELDSNRNLSVHP